MTKHNGQLSILCIYYSSHAVYA